jgi:hypothetical protein
LQILFSSASNNINPRNQVVKKHMGKHDQLLIGAHRRKRQQERS